MKAVSEYLLREGIQKFIDPYDAMLAAIEDKYSEQIQVIGETKQA
jgi:hypothetical protein